MAVSEIDLMIYKALLHLATQQQVASKVANCSSFSRWSAGLTDSQLEKKDLLINRQKSVSDGGFFYCTFALINRPASTKRIVLKLVGKQVIAHLRDFGLELSAQTGLVRSLGEAGTTLHQAADTHNTIKSSGTKLKYSREKGKLPDFIENKDLGNAAADGFAMGTDLSFNELAEGSDNQFFLACQKFYLMGGIARLCKSTAGDVDLTIRFADDHKHLGRWQDWMFFQGPGKPQENFDYYLNVSSAKSYIYDEGEKLIR